MRYESIRKKSKNHIRRLTGVKWQTFEKMVSIIKEVEKNKYEKGGRPNKLCVEDRILMMLMYWREYRTYAHIAETYELSESNAYMNIKCVENILVNSKVFKLPGKKSLLKSDYVFEVILIDATETPIQRPKKTSVCTTLVKRNVTA